MKKLFLMVFLTGILSAEVQTIGFAAGCFWGVEKHFEGIKGVKDAVSGYAGGSQSNPSYEDIIKKRFNSDGKNHAETVKVVYDDQEISTRELIEDFWELHDPTQGDRQGNDVGDNYRSVIFYTTPDQKKVATETMEEYQKLLTKAGYGKITTRIEPLQKFYPAEEYHQDYLKKNPNGYCPDHSTGVKFSKKMIKKHSAVKSLGGKEIIVIDADGCPFCERFAKDVTSGYKGSIPLRTSHKEYLKGFKIKTKLDATPTILFIEDGKEVFAYRGYMSPEKFYQAVGVFKLGSDSEAFNVAFKRGTDGRFCKQYDKFKNTGDGVFIDKLSGDILFDTRDRFNSHSGWLSFYKSVDGSTIEKPDDSFGMHRIEVIAKKSGIHLGHVFDDAPGGKRRFCINATVLEFVPREKINK